MRLLGKPETLCASCSAPLDPQKHCAIVAGVGLLCVPCMHARDWQQAARSRHSVKNTADAQQVAIESALAEIDTLRSQAEQQREICATAHARTIRDLEQRERWLSTARSSCLHLREQRDTLFELLQRYAPPSVIRDWRESIDDPCDECEGNGSIVLERNENGAVERSGRECKACSGSGIFTREVP